MDFEEFVAHPDTRIPQSWSGDDFPGFLEDMFHRHWEPLSQYLVGKEINDQPMFDGLKRQYFALTNGIVESSRQFMSGKLYSAYNTFTKVLESEFSETLDRNTLLLNKGENLFFRVRDAVDGIEEKEDIFHIPFQKRHLVGSERYSVIGLPCLYLSGSLFTCWRELNAPPLHRLNCSGFWVKREKGIKVIDLRHPFNKLSFDKRINLNNTEDFTQIISDAIGMWPLIAACSIRVQHKSTPFKPEYVIPQMLLEWVKENKEFDGIAYISTKSIDHIKLDSDFLGVNLAIPTKEISVNGRCGFLCNSFQMTYPTRWEMLCESKKSTAFRDPRNAILPMRNSGLLYSDTTFDKVERAINRQKIQSVSTPTNYPDGYFDIQP